jgi:aldose 1-epimerase
MTLTLRAGDLHVGLDPGTGGAIASLAWRGISLLRPVRDARLAAQNGHAVAAYPLIPYANRIDHGRFTLHGQTYQLARNFGDEPHSIHGNAWMRAWAVTESDRSSARLTLDHRPPRDPGAEWPFAYHAEQLFDASEDRLEIGISLLNTDSVAFPAGIGLHPYVARTPKSTLCLQADTIWRTGPDGLPARRIALPEDLEFDRPRPIGATEIDSCFAGWGGSASLEMPEHQLTLHIEAGPPMDHFQVYTPSGQDYCGLEPVSNMPDGINRMDTISDQGMVMLAPRQSLRACVTFRVMRHIRQT